MRIQRNFDLGKPNYMKKSEYETNFEEISVPYNKKLFKT